MNERTNEAVSSATGKGQTGILLAVVMLAFMGQMMLNPILAPLARMIGLEEWHVGAIISMAALVLTLLSQFWGRRSQKVGPKRVLIFAMLLGFLALGSFALVAYAGSRGLIAGFWLVFGAVATRGILYGSAISAVLPAAQSYLVSQCESEEDRVKAVGGIGAMNGLSGVIGSVFGGVLSMIGGLMLPLSIMPFMMLVALAVLAAAFKPSANARVVDEPAKVSYFDPRVFPFLLVGFFMFLAFSSLQTTIGFAVQDRLALDETLTAGYTSLIMIVMSVTMIVCQAVVVPRLKWSARRLLRVGFVLLSISGVLFLVGNTLALLLIAAVTIGVGVGFAMPGYNAGPTMDMAHEEQGGLAGLISANNGATYIIAPVLSTSLYGWAPLSSFVLVIVLLVAGLALCLLHPTLRNERK